MRRLRWLTLSGFAILAAMAFLVTRTEAQPGSVKLIVPGVWFREGDLEKLGYRLAASSGTAFVAMHKAVKESYECLANDTLDPFLGRGGAETEMKEAHRTCDLEKYLAIEKRTVKE